MAGYSPCLRENILLNRGDNHTSIVQPRTLAAIVKDAIEVKMTPPLIPGELT